MGKGVSDSWHSTLAASIGLPPPSPMSILAPTFRISLVASRIPAIANMPVSIRTALRPENLRACSPMPENVAACKPSSARSFSTCFTIGDLFAKLFPVIMSAFGAEIIARRVSGNLAIVPGPVWIADTGCRRQLP
jgi:hypothetical protein